MNARIHPEKYEEGNDEKFAVCKSNIGKYLNGGKNKKDVTIQ